MTREVALVFPLPQVAAAGSDSVADFLSYERSVIERRLQSGVGLSFSGGGSRAMSAAMGYLRGLNELGVLEHADYLSAVSGSAWAASIFTYLPDTIEDEDLLGPVHAPQDVSWSNLVAQTPNNMGRVPQHLGFLQDTEAVLKMIATYGYYEHDIWVRLTGDRILGPFGLNDLNSNGNPSRFYSYTPDYLEQEILGANPHLSADDFHLVERKRPFLIIGASLFSGSGHDGELLPVESTPLGIGIRGTFRAAENDQRLLGGGLVQPFAFGSTDQAQAGDDRVALEIGNRFSLSDITGLSSAFFAEVVETRIPILGDLVPRYSYWPVGNPGQPASVQRFADGGNLENTGINALLARGVKTVISFVNADVEIESVGDVGGKPVVRVDSSIPPLFGFAPLGDSDRYRRYADGDINGDEAVFADNQVFESHRFDELTAQLLQARMSGGPVMYFQKGLNVLSNQKFNIHGEMLDPEQQVDILWVYLSKAENWWNRLPEALRSRIAAEHEEFGNFPHYKTGTQIELSARQVNLLANMTSWMITQDLDVVAGSDEMTSNALVRSMFGQE